MHRAVMEQCRSLSGALEQLQPGALAQHSLAECVFFIMLLFTQPPHYQFSCHVPLVDTPGQQSGCLEFIAALHCAYVLPLCRCVVFHWPVSPDELGLMSPAVTVHHKPLSGQLCILCESSWQLYCWAAQALFAAEM